MTTPPSLFDPVVSRYAHSMQRICQYVGLPVPSDHTLFPSPPLPSSNNCSPEVELEDRLSEAYAKTDPFLQSETNPAYRELLQQAPPTQRHTLSVKRHVGLTLWTALRKRKCLYCWLPQHMCMCRELWIARQAYLQSVAGQQQQGTASSPSSPSSAVVDVTMFLHAEEFFRTTNTAHLCAFIMDSPMRVWGVPEDDAWLAHLHQPQSENNAAEESTVAAATPTSNVETDVQYALLYPEEGCMQVSDLLSSMPPHQTLHYVLSDGTWNQAHRVNRHVPRTVPRVALTIDPNYTSLFSSLRKQTRETGVSTLEATAMAVRLRLLHVGAESVAETLHEALVSQMKQYVDKVCIQKRQAAVYANDSEKISAWKTERNAHNTWEYRTYHEEKEKQRVAGLLEDIGHDLRVLLPPPVVSYCYVCDKFIGWSRMDSHVMGQQHKDQLLKNPTWEPSELSRRPEKGNWHVTSRHSSIPLQN